MTREPSAYGTMRTRAWRRPKPARMPLAGFWRPPSALETARALRAATLAARLRAARAAWDAIP